MKKINYQLEIIFLEGLHKIVEQVRRNHDDGRDSISTGINMLFNNDWGKNSQWMKRGELLGSLKNGETILNMTVTDLINVEQLIKGRLSELRSCLYKKKIIKINKEKL